MTQPLEGLRVIDVGTRTTWDAFGLAVKGPLKGTRLKPLILIPEFWFAWSQFRPGTRVFTAAGAPATSTPRESIRGIQPTTNHQPPTTNQ